ncbi:transposase [Streptomyces tanashiensis]|uniref:transposase n=1 Tax=Streptomyces tanashiensis TaxID=67367 RepID=UPI003F4DBEEF
MGRGDQTNGQWARLEPLLPRGVKPGHPQVWTRRQLVDGIRWRTQTGAPWRDVPERYGPWDRAYDLFRRWQRGLGLGRDPHAAPGPGGRERPDHLGGQRRLHRLPGPTGTLTGRREEGPPEGAARRCLRRAGQPRPRAGLGRADQQNPPAVEQGQKPLSVVITAGQRGDSPRFEPVLEAIRVPGWDSADRASVWAGSGRPARRTTPPGTAPTCADTGPRPCFRCLQAGSATG